jgi:hypothetical protein
MGAALPAGLAKLHYDEEGLPRPGVNVINWGPPENRTRERFLEKYGAQNDDEKNFPTSTAISGGTPEPPVVPLLQQTPKTSGTPQPSFIKQNKRSLGKSARPRAKQGNRAALLSDSDEPRLG